MDVSHFRLGVGGADEVLTSSARFSAKGLTPQNRDDRLYLFLQGKQWAVKDRSCVDAAACLARGYAAASESSALLCHLTCPNAL